jgi:hypothetical protein
MTFWSEDFPGPKQVFIPAKAGRFRWVAIAAATAWFLAACASGNRPAKSPTPDRNPYLITVGELEASQRMNVYEAVRDLRPNWLWQRRGRTGEALVYLDERAVGTASSLRRFSTNVVAELRYLSANEAQLRFGQLNGQRPAIVVELIK